MPIRFVSGDLFENEHDAQAFAHGCNCQVSMGAGVTRTFRARYEERRRSSGERHMARSILKFASVTARPSPIVHQ